LIFNEVNSADGLSIAFVRVGRGPPLVIVHGGLTVAEDWIPVANELGSTHTVYVMDRRGQGRSDDAGRAYSLQREIDDVAALIHEAGDGPILFGHSFGGGLALGYAIQSGFSENLILYEPGHAVADSNWFSGKYLSTAEELLTLGRAEDALRLIYAESGGTAMTEEVQRLRQTPRWTLQVTLVSSLLREIRALEGFAPSARDLACIKSRVTVLVGTETPFAMQYGSAASLVGRIRDLSLLPILGQGHNCHIWDPPLMAQMILSATKSPAARAAGTPDQQP
jgi:pimeloyl-ACP methyl ester carboxylesterase